MSAAARPDGAVFDGGWLSCREAADHRSRAPGLTVAAARFVGARRRRIVVDLGAGHGSNWRYLAPRLPGDCDWRLVDGDAALLASMTPPETPQTIDGRAPERVCRDLAAPLTDLIEGAALVTASALLDLASARWIETLCRACAAQRSAVLMALTIDGRIDWPGAPDTLNNHLTRLLARDHHRDKGLGPALGGDAGPVLARALAAEGYAVTSMPSPWRLDRRDRALADRLIEGWRETARRQAPECAPAWDGWSERRRAAITDGGTLCVGHVDVLGLPGPATGRSRNAARSRS